MNFGNGLRVKGRAVIARRDKLAPGAIEVAAPVSHNTVTAVRSVATAAVTDDGVIGNSFRDRDLIDRDNETVVRGQRVHAIGKTLQLQRRWVGGLRFAQGPANCEQLRWCSHQHRADATDPIAGQVATTMRRGHENYASNIAPMLEDKNLFQKTLALWIHLCLSRRMSKSFEPESRAGIGKQRSGYRSAHAVGYHHHRLA